MKKRFKINKYSYKNFNQIIKKKSPYLNNLSTQNNKSLKSLNSQKIDILFDEITGNNKFKRNYVLFEPSSVTNINNNNINNSEDIKVNNIEKNISNKIPLLFPYLKIVMTSPNEREFPEKYQKKDFMIDKFSGMYLKPKPISLHKIKLNKIENNSYKQYLKKSRINNSSQFCLPILNKDHFLSSEVKNNRAFFSCNNISLQ